MTLFNYIKCVRRVIVARRIASKRRTAPPGRASRRRKVSIGKPQQNFENIFIIANSLKNILSAIS